MKFSLFYEMQISDPTPETEAQMFHDCVEQAVLADRLGYHAVWEVEHHGLYEYSHSSAPEVFLSYVAAKTERIRLGHGITLTPHRYNHPIRIAERIAETPADPYSFLINWGGRAEDAFHILANPPGLPYWLALWGEAFGWSESVFHASMIPFGVIALLAFAVLAREFDQRLRFAEPVAVPGNEGRRSADIAVSFTPEALEHVQKLGGLAVIDLVCLDH